MNDIQKKYSHLYDFLAAWFHQDFDLDSGTPDQVVTQFISTTSPAIIKHCIKEIDSLLSKNHSENELEIIIFDLGSYYDVNADGLTFSKWLSHLRQEFDKAVS